MFIYDQTHPSICPVCSSVKLSFVFRVDHKSMYIKSCTLSSPAKKCTNKPMFLLSGTHQEARYVTKVKSYTQITILPFLFYFYVTLIKHSNNVKNALGLLPAALYCRYLKLAPILGRLKSEQKVKSLHNICEYKLRQ